MKRISVSYKPDDVLHAHYAARLNEFAAAGRDARLPKAADDQRKIALILVDYQHDFVHAGGALHVPGAVEDVQRFLSWFYTNVASITSIYSSLDTHVPMQIFFSSWWQNSHGEHPAHGTTITVEDVQTRRWIPQQEPEWSERYVNLLRAHTKKELIIWPYHAMEGTLGHMLVAPVSEAIMYHSAARQTQPTYIIKGRTIRTEYYGIFGAEVADPKDRASYLNTPLLDALEEHDLVYVAGEARSHCVLETAKQILKHFERQPNLIKRLRFLKDCTSCVQFAAPPQEKKQAQDEREKANEVIRQTTEKELNEMEAQGVRLVNSTDPIVL